MRQGSFAVITVTIIVYSLYANHLFVHCPNVYFLSTYYVSSSTFLTLPLLWRQAQGRSTSLFPTPWGLNWGFPPFFPVLSLPYSYHLVLF